MDKFSYITHAHPDYIESLYREYKQDPRRVDESWQKFFEGFEFALKGDGRLTAADEEHIRKEFKVLNLIHGYRTRGHLFTKTNPVRTRRKYSPTLALENFGLSDADLDTVFHAGEEIGIGPATLREIVAHLEQTYCASVGVEYMYIRQPEKVKWLQERMESTRNLPTLTIDEKRHILHKLNQAVVFEKFLHTKYVGQKRFALSGGETLIPGLDFLMNKGAELGVQEFFIGMPHRGRLNVLVNILNKSVDEVFSEFEGEEYVDAVFAGDVKYHLGFTNDVETRSGKRIRIHLAPNPSHLEAVDPVVEGMARSKIDHAYDGDVDRVVPILIHGDAAIAGQGVVYEVVQMSLLNAYHTGGTIHIVVNNQVGFTTNYLEGRSSTYCTDVGKVVLSPVFHVNADDAEAVVYTVQLAMEYRQKFHTDVFIDLLGYRRYGHNEADEPRYTQPKLYKIIEKHPDPREIYYQKLLASGSVEQGMAEEMEVEYRNMLQEHLALVKEKKVTRSQPVVDKCDQIRRQKKFNFEDSLFTAVPEERLKALAERTFFIPEEWHAFPKIRRLYEERLKMVQEGKALDWGTAELLAYATLLSEGTPVRLCGQDTKRGTFAHRHAVVLDEETEQEYVPLNHLDERQAPFWVFNSLLSEYGALGFEYGYACATPEGLTIWEAQFGDFANGAQIVIDQFISSSEAKWQRMNGLVLYLPHGYEGQGPEHSSARIERFLELSANENWVLANCTTPANFFHLLRRHMRMPFRVPLVIFTPKSLLRHPACVSPLKDFAQGQFQPVIDEENASPDRVKKILLCSGKIYYELLEKKMNEQRQDVAIIRLEQIYPLPVKRLQKVFKKYTKAPQVVWVQEEPENMGVWPYLERKFKLVPLEVVARPESPSPATGRFKQHILEQELLLERAFKNEAKGRKSA